MDRQLQAAWQQRAPDLPYRNPYEALIMASVVEKETGQATDRAQIAGVFVNRLRIGMMLQTDPSVIYGLGEKFDGNLRKRDLLADTPHNTYTAPGCRRRRSPCPARRRCSSAQPGQDHGLVFRGPRRRLERVLADIGRA